MSDLPSDLIVAYTYWSLSENGRCTVPVCRAPFCAFLLSFFFFSSRRKDWFQHHLLRLMLTEDFLGRVLSCFNVVFWENDRLCGKILRIFIITLLINNVRMTGGSFSSAASGYGTQSIRLGKDAIKDFDCCCLSLQPCQDPVVTYVSFFRHAHCVFLYSLNHCLGINIQ